MRIKIDVCNDRALVTSRCLRARLGSTEVYL